jgi:hypothetical protein
MCSFKWWMPVKWDNLAGWLKIWLILELICILTNAALFSFFQILGLDICANTLVGDNMNRGISGGQKKRVTTGTSSRL